MKPSAERGWRAERNPINDDHWIRSRLRVILGPVTQRRGENGAGGGKEGVAGGETKDSLYLLDALLRPFEIVLCLAGYFDAF